MNRKRDSSDAPSVNTPGVTIAEVLGKQFLPVLVKPGAVRTEILGVREARLHIALHAPAIEGKANEALLKFLSKQTGKRYEIVAGGSTRRKLLKSQ